MLSHSLIYLFCYVWFYKEQKNSLVLGGIKMDVKKTIVIILIICMSISLVATYYFMDKTKQTEIKSVKNYYECEMWNLKSYVSYMENTTDELNEEIEDVETLLSNVREQLDLVNYSLQENISELNKLKSGNNYNLHDPTYNELTIFIAQDKTNEEEYIENVFDCEQFSQLVNTNAENAGIRCAYVVIYFEGTDSGHGIVGFNTVDQGMVYFEPQSDEWVENLEIGYDFWTDCIIPTGNYYYEESPNDTIKEVLLFW